MTKQIFPKPYNRNLINILIIVFQQVDNEFLNIARTEQLADGTTCLMALIINRKLTIANLGDSSAILIRNKQMLELTSE